MASNMIYSVVFVEKSTGLRRPVYDCTSEIEANQRCEALNQQKEPEHQESHYVVMRGTKEMRFAEKKA